MAAGGLACSTERQCGLPAQNDDYYRPETSAERYIWRGDFVQGGMAGIPNCSVAWQR